MEGVKNLAKNTGLLAVGQFGTKLLSFFLVPLYTYVLSTAEYGTYDFINTTVSLLVPILSLNICDSALRFPLDKNVDRSQIFSISVFHFIASVLFGVILIGANLYFDFISVVNDYPILFILMFAGTAINGIMNCFTRGIDRIKDIAISGVFSSAVTIGLNLLFLLPLRMGLVGFFLAMIFGGVSQTIYLFIAIKGWRYLRLTHFDKQLHQDMTDFSKPLILNNISWWVNGVSNRYIITWFCGIAANGIYSVSYKIPSILVMFQGIFSQAWTLSAVQGYDKNDTNGFFTKMYQCYNLCMVLVCSILIILSRVLALFLYSNEFYSAWKYVPFLLISSVFGALSGYIGGIYAATKDTRLFAQTSIIGAVTNLLLTLVLVWKIGVMGAAIAAPVSYGIIWYLRIRSVSKYMNMKISLFKDVLGYTILCIQTFLLFVLDDNVIFFLLQFLSLGILLLLNKELLILILNKITNKILKGGK